MVVNIPLSTSRSHLHLHCGIMREEGEDIMNDHSKTVAALKRRGYEAGAVADGTDWLVVKPMA